MPRKPAPKSPYETDSLEFGDILDKHLERLHWSEEHLSTCLGSQRDEKLKVLRRLRRGRAKGDNEEVDVLRDLSLALAEEYRRSEMDDDVELQVYKSDLARLRLLAEFVTALISWNSAVSGFLFLIYTHMRDSKLTQSKFCELSGIARSKLWSWANGESFPTRVDVNRAAFAFASAYAALRRAGESPLRFNGIDDHDRIASGLFIAAGLQPLTGSDVDLSWQRISASPDDRSVLRVGWFEWSPLAQGRTGESREPEGVAAEIVHVLGALLGTRIRWRRIKLTEISHSIENRDIDLIAPLVLRFPSRFTDLRLSRQIPGFGLRTNALIHRDHLVDALREGASLAYKGQRPYARRAEIDTRKLQLEVTDTEVGRGLGEMFRLGWTGASKPIRSKFGSLREAYRSLLEEPVVPENGLVRAFVTDSLTCNKALLECGGAIVPLLLDSSAPRYQIELCFAAHHSEVRLIDAVDECIRIMQEEGTLQDQIRKANEDDPLLELALKNPAQILKKTTRKSE